MNDIYWIGSAPAEEHYASVGDPDYARDARAECAAFIKAIRIVCGPEPEGARLTVKSQPHDFSSYYEVTVVFDGDNRQACEYAAKVDGHAPTTWAEAGMAAPRAAGRGR